MPLSVRRTITTIPQTGHPNAEECDLADQNAVAGPDDHRNTQAGLVVIHKCRETPSGSSGW